jgi:hypothetical protein
LRGERQPDEYEQVSRHRTIQSAASFPNSRLRPV